MKIKTSLLVLCAVFFVSIAVVGSVMLRTFAEMNRAIRGSNNAVEMMRGVFELEILTYEYLMYHEERMQRQWALRHESLGKILEAMGKEERAPELVSSLESIARDYDVVGDLLSQVQGTFAERKRLAEEGRPQGEMDLSLALERRLTAQVLVGSQRIAGNARRFSALIQERIARLQRTASVVVLFSVVAFGILSLCISVATVRGITRPLNELVKGAEAIGRGDLQHKIELRTRNEMGQLGDAFNRMAEDLQRAREALAAETERLTVTLRSIGDAVIASDTEGKVVLLNAVAESLTGWAEDEAAGRPLHEVFHIINEKTRQRCEDPVSKVLESGLVVGLANHTALIARDGTERIIADSGAPVRGTDGSIIGVVMVFRDVTEQKRAEDELTRHREHLEELVEERTGELARSNRELESYAYVVSHDLQEPLRMMSSFAQLLSRDYGGAFDERAGDFIARIVDGAKRMGMLIDDLLVLSRVGREEEPGSATDCSDAFDLAVGNLQAAIEESGATVTQEGLPKIAANPSQMAQLFQNLVGNAIKYRGDERPEVHATAQRDADGWLFSVRDNGIGMEPEQLERIFTIFQRLHPRDKYSGTGIGLAICRKIVELYGGRIWAESEPGKGSTFFFTIPEGET